MQFFSAVSNRGGLTHPHVKTSPVGSTRTALGSPPDHRRETLLPERLHSTATAPEAISPRKIYAAGTVYHHGRWRHGGSRRHSPDWQHHMVTTRAVRSTQLGRSTLSPPTVKVCAQRRPDHADHPDFRRLQRMPPRPQPDSSTVSAFLPRLALMSSLPVCRRAAQLLLDAQQPGVLTTRSSAPSDPVLIWARASGHGQIRR